MNDDTHAQQPAYTPHPDAEALEELRHHWGEAYTIEQTGPATWLAARRDGQGALHASTADDLFEAIRLDYDRRPISRDGDA